MLLNLDAICAHLQSIVLYYFQSLKYTITMLVKFLQVFQIFANSKQKMVLACFVSQIVFYFKESVLILLLLRSAENMLAHWILPKESTHRQDARNRMCAQVQLLCGKLSNPSGEVYRAPTSIVRGKGCLI